MGQTTVQDSETYSKAITSKRILYTNQQRKKAKAWFPDVLVHCSPGCRQSRDNGEEETLLLIEFWVVQVIGFV